MRILKISKTIRFSRFIVILPTLILSLIVLSQTPAHAGKKTNIRYQMDLGQPNSHLFEITVTVDNPEGEFVDFSLPAWRPGRYEVQNYAVNVQEFRAFDGSNEPLRFFKTDKQTWKIERENAKQVMVKYKYYANKMDAGNSMLNDEEVYFNGSNLFMYVVGRKDESVSLRINYPDGWKVATGLTTTSDPKIFTAEDYDLLIDCPTVISPKLTKFSFDYENVLYYIWIQGEGNYDSKKIIEDVKKIVGEQVDMMKGAPMSEYHFIYHLVPYDFGHGVEHSNSTSIVFGPGNKFDDDQTYRRFLGVTSHEFFHTWNVKRIRPYGLDPFDYTKETYSTLYYVAEGFTSYYGSLTLKRSGLIDGKKYLEYIEHDIRNLQNTYGRKITSLELSSWDVWLIGYEGKAPPNKSVSFYSKGEMVGMMMDLEIRNRTLNQQSLDDVMRYLDKNFARQNKGFTKDEFQTAVETVAGSDFEVFFREYVRGTTEIDYGKFFIHAGLELRTEKDEDKPKTWLGISISGDEKETKIWSVVPESPAYKAGLDKDDILLAMDRRRIDSDNLTEELKKKKPGDKVTITVFRRGELRDFEVELEGGHNIKHKLEQIENPTELQKEIYSSWLNESWEERKSNEEVQD